MRCTICWILGVLAFSLVQAQEPAIQISKRGPGMKGPTDHVKLPVPRSFDLTHVEPAHYAAALDKDPQRIFEFVRDHVAFESYPGCLRGPRGTLLAMAGNSVDRAALLAGLLEKSGHKVRFARGTLPEAQAKELVTSMWAVRPRQAPDKAEKEPPAALKKAMETLAAASKRDYILIRDHLRKVDKLPAPAPGTSLQALVKEARHHYWVQWDKEGKWIDLDPSFADSTPGRAITNPEDVFNSLPEEVFQRLEIRIRVEEYAVLLKGEEATKPASRVILTHKTRTADVSGIDLVLVHQPENWQGPAKDVKSALSSAVKDTGRTRPVLLTSQEKWVVGEAFRQKLPAGKGIGGIGDLLGGEGTRKPTPIATAEWIECDFLSPDGGKETVVREVFDVVGTGPEGSKNLPANEVRAKAASGEVKIDRQVLSLFFTTGRIEMANLRQAVNDSLPKKKDTPVDARALLRQISIGFVTLSDALFAQPADPDKNLIRFYPDSPRLQIVELNGDTGRFAMDLRRDRVRAVAMDDLETLLPARVFRGVVEGTLERVLVEYLTADLGKKVAWKPIVSTSSLFERAHQEGIPTVLLSGDSSERVKAFSKNTRIRLQKTLADGLWVLAPERSLDVGKSQRLAWWQIDPRTGETIAVTDDGLHGGTTSTENKVVISTVGGGVIRVTVTSPTFSETVELLGENLGMYLARLPGWTWPGFWNVLDKRLGGG